jgi:tetratricopeptide (TPR) repeat protein
MSRVYQELTRYSEGLECSNKSLALLRTSHAKDLNRKDVASALFNRGCCQMVIGKLAQAVDDFTECLNIWKALETFDQAPRAMAVLTVYLGHCNIILGKLKPGLESLKTSITAWHTHLKVESRDATTIKAYLWCGQGHLNTSEYLTSEFHLEKGYKQCQETFGDQFNHPLTSEALSSLGFLHLEMGKFFSDGF